MKKLENGVVTEYTYNQLNQLTEETTEGVTISYAYDVNGNLLCRGTDTEYDTYTYTGENQLASVTSHKAGSETTETYTYDAEGNRHSKTTTKSTVTTGTDTTGTDTDSTSEIVSEEVTYYVMDTITGYSQVIAELDENRETKVLYTRGDGLVSREEIIGTGEADSSNPGTEEESTIHFYLSDGHGDVRQLTDENGKVTDSYRYNSFGELEERAGVTDNPYLYTGEYYDEGTGLYYLRARYMNPETGTFISMDSYLGNSYDPASLHRYTYAQNNPQMYNDPSGHFAGLIGAQVNLTCSEILRNHQALHMMGMVNGMMNSILNQVLGTGSDPVKDFLLGYVTGYGLGAAYVGASIIGALYELQILLGLMAFHLGFANSVNEIKIAMAIGFGVTGNNKEAIIHLTLAVVSLVAAMFALRMTGTILAEGPKGVVGFDVDGGSESGSNTSWYKADGTMNYPPNNGAVPGTEVNMTLKSGDTLGRYGNIGDKSNFVTQTGADASKLALPPNTDPAIYQEFKVVKDIPGAIQAEIAPWGGSTGGGLQYELPMPILQLIREGYIVPR